MRAPIVFVSYSHDSEAHKAWVKKLATDLRNQGVDIILDQWDLAFGQDIAAFMQDGVSRSDRVLMICSEPYIIKADGRSGGVAYERLIVTAELIENIDTKKFIPVIRDNASSRKVPQFLGPRAYADFTRDQDYSDRLDDLLREIHGFASLAKPPLGPNPFSSAISSAVPSPRIAGPTGITDTGKSLLEDPWFARDAQTASSGLEKLDFKGSMELRYALHDLINRSQVELLNAVRKSEIHTFGWPIGVVLDNKPEYRPRPIVDGIYAEISIPKSAMTGRPSYDYWTLRNNGDFYLLQSLFEDDRDKNAIFFNSRIVRVTEGLLFGANLYKALDVPDETKVSVRVAHRGFAGRTLSSSNPQRHILPRQAVEDVSETEIVEEVGQLRMHLVDNVQHLLEPLFTLFDFMEFDHKVYEQIVTDFANGHST